MRVALTLTTLKSRFSNVVFGLGPGECGWRAASIDTTQDKDVIDAINPLLLTLSD